MCRQPDGTFLVRDSTSEPNAYTLVVAFVNDFLLSGHLSLSAGLIYGLGTLFS